jgi:hypothetical protein
MRFISRDMLRAAINAQESDTFDSHDIERYIYRYYQVAFVRELYANIDAEPYPFTETCRQIGLELSRMTDDIVKIGEHNSSTFSGQMRPCALWRRLQR